MARKNKSTSVERSTGVSTQGEKVHLGERVDIGKGKTNKRKGPRDYVSGSTSAYNLLGLILIIGLIATVFFAYYNSTSDSETFQYFSPKVFLENFSDDTILIAEGNYIVDFPVEWGIDDLFTSSVRGYVDVDGRKIGSINTLSLVESFSHSDLYFRINGEYYTAIWQYVDDLGGNAYVLSLPTLYITIDSMPDIQYVIDSWSSVSADNVFDVIQETFVYVGDYMAYIGNTILNFLPWNSVATVQDDDPNLEQLWREAEIRAGVE